MSIGAHTCDPRFNHVPDILSRHLHPDRPVVAPAIPLAAGVPDVFAPQGGAKLAIVLNIRISRPIARIISMRRIASGSLPDRSSSAQSGWAYCDRWHHHNSHQRNDWCIFTTKGQHSAKVPGVAQRKVNGMIGTKATAVGDHERVRIFGLGQRQNFVEQIGFILKMTLDTPSGMRMPNCRSFRHPHYRHNRPATRHVQFAPPGCADRPRSSYS